MDRLFTLALLIHLLAVLLMVAAMALQATVVLLTRQATSAVEVRRLLAAARWIPRLFAPATLLILLSGCYMATMLVLAGARWGWVAVSFVALIGLAAFGKSSGKRQNIKLARLVADSGASLSPALEAALRDPAPLFHVALGGWGVAGLVVLMVYEPRIWVSIAVLIVALLATALTNTLVNRWPVAAAEPSTAPGKVRG